ncbi:hypothetical protein A6033_10250 [Aeromonas veronii]|nr:hypothetical protein A6033_10250 [Aeromonas veronii]
MPIFRLFTGGFTLGSPKSIDEFVQLLWSEGAPALLIIGIVLHRSQHIAEILGDISLGPEPSEEGPDIVEVGLLSLFGQRGKAPLA